MMLYGYKRTSKGRQRSEFPLGRIDWEGKLVLQVRDRTLRENLRKYFEEPIWVPVPLGDEDGFMGHTWECLKPGDEEHFLEAVKRLHRQEMFVDLDS
jgi:hypothetical protein